MRSSTRGLAAAAALIACVGAALAAPQGFEDDQPPTFLPFSYPPDGSHMMGETKPGIRPPGTPGVTAPLVPPTVKSAPAAPRTHAEILDDLFHRLAGAADTDEASGLAARIQRLWLDSGSDTADLLMSRASTAAAKGNSKLAGDLLDRIVVLAPVWAEAWNKRANLRFLGGDDDGAMEDIGHVLALEPRHFGALTGMAVIMQRHGFKKDALSLLRKAADIYPHNSDLTDMVDKLTLDVEGRPI